MKTILFKSLCLVLFTFSSCIGQEQVIRKSLKKCVDENVKEKRSYLIEDKFDFFPFVEELERLMVKEKIINSDSKKAYESFFKAEKPLSPGNKNVKQFLEKNDFVVGQYLERVISYCSYRTLMEEKVEFESFFRGYVGNIRILSENGFSGRKDMLHFVQGIPDNYFSEITFRYPAILFVALKASSDD